MRSGFHLQRCVAEGVCALLLLSRLSWPASAADTKPLNAILIVARNDLPDSNFAHSVVLVMNNLGPGPIGIIINRPWFLFRAATPPPHAVQACDDVYLSADPELLLHLLGRDKPMDSLRIYLGHAGWLPGQLEAEIERHDWTSNRAEAAAIFGGKSEYPWPSPQDPTHGI